MSFAQQLFRRKTAADVIADAEHGEHQLKRTLGAFDLAMLGIGAIIGAGIFSAVKDMIVGTDQVPGAGPAVMISFVLTALTCGFAALCYAEIAAMVPTAGSAYTYAYLAFGELIAWIIGWDLIIEYAIGNIYLAQSWGDYLGSLLRATAGVDFPAWLRMDLQTATAAAGEHPEWFAGLPRIGGYVMSFNFPAFLVTMLLTVLLVRGVRESARVNTLMVVLKVGLVLLFVIVGATAIDTANWKPFAPGGVKGIWGGAALGFFAYIGFDAVSTAAEETRDPQRNIPRGMIGSLIVCTVLYVAVAAVLTGIVPSSALTEQDPLAQALRVAGFKGTSIIIAGGGVIAFTAVLLVFQLGQARIFMVMSRDGLLPKAFARVHPRFRTPHVGTILTGLFVALASSVLTPNQAIKLCNIGTLFAFVLVSLGVIALRKLEPNRHRPFKVPGYPLTPLLSAGCCIALMFGLERSNWLRLLVWLAIGLVIYFSFGMRNSRLAKRAAS
jgi:APA family basic amino acid/polyamine antiporter